MACINPDGTLTKSAKALLQAIETPLSAEEISAAIGQPLFKVRSSLREMGNAGLIGENEGRHQITDTGKEALALGG